MKIKQYPGKVIMDDPWMAIGDRTMEMVYAANWVDTHRNLVESQSSSSGSWNSTEENVQPKPRSNISRSKSCRDVAKPTVLKEFDKEYSIDDNNLNSAYGDANISQLAKYQQHMEEQTRASKEFLSSQRQLQPSFSFKGLNGYKPSTLRRIKRRQYKEWDVDEEKNDFPTILPPNIDKSHKKDSFKYLLRQRKHDPNQRTPCPPDMSDMRPPVHQDPSAESFYQYYSRISQQEDLETSQPPKSGYVNDKKKVVPAGERPVPAPRTTAPAKLHKESQNKSSTSSSSSAHSIESYVPKRIEANGHSRRHSPTSDYRKSTGDRFSWDSQYGSNSSPDDSQSESVNVAAEILRTTVIGANNGGSQRFPYGKQHRNELGSKVNGSSAPTKPAVRSKSLRLKSDTKTTVFRKDVEGRFAYDNIDHMGQTVTVTQPKRTISPIDQLNLMQQTKNGFGQPKFHTVRVKSQPENRSLYYPEEFVSRTELVKSNDSINGDYVTHKNSSSGDSDSDFSIPRPKLIVPVHTYGIRKRRTGNLVQREREEELETSVDNGSVNGAAEDDNGKL